MKKNFTFFLALIVCIQTSAQTSSNWFTVKAFLPEWNGAAVSLFFNEQLLSSDSVKRDMYVFTGSTDNVLPGRMTIKKGKQIIHVPLFIEQGTIKIRDAGNRILVAYGTPSNDLYYSLNKRFDSLAAQQNLRFSDIINFKRSLATEFISNHTSSPASIQLLKDYYYLTSVNDSLYHLLIHSLDQSLQQTFLGREILKDADTRFATAIGKEAPSLQLKDTSGHIVSIEQIGGYTLLDFWASWCIPCRKENAELIKIFKKYQPSGFAIIGVSVDTNKASWLNAIKKDKLAWKQFCDLKGWNSTVVQAYGIKAVPMNYLLDKNGIIVAKNLHAEQLDKLLSNLLQKKTF